MIPGGLALVVLILGAYRLTRLIGWDDFPLAVRMRRLATGDEWDDMLELPRYRRPTLAHLIGCPFCLGFWVSAATYVAWLELPTATFYVLMPFAISGAVGLIAKNLDP